MSRDESRKADELVALVYTELRNLAVRKLARETPGQTLQPTALVHEAWLKLTSDEQQKWNDRTHFFAAAAEAMRRILVDNARRKRTSKHGGDRQRVDLTDIRLEISTDDQLLAVNEALEKFATVDREKAELVKLRFFAGLSIEEAAKVLGFSTGTAKRYWAYARAWLYEEITRQ